MNQRDIIIAKALGQELRELVSEIKKEFIDSLQELKGNIDHIDDKLNKKIDDVRNLNKSEINSIVDKSIANIEPPELPDINKLVNNVIDLLPKEEQREILTIDDIKPIIKELVEKEIDRLPKPENGKDYNHEEMLRAIDKAVSKLPSPKDGKDGKNGNNGIDGKSVTVDDVIPFLEKIAKEEIAKIPSPKDGKDYDHEEMLRAIDNAISKLPVPKDGKSVTVDDLMPVLNEIIQEELKKQPTPENGKNGKDGQDGKDALNLEILPTIDTEKSYPRGTYANYNGGLWRSFQKTSGIHGWECIVDGISSIDIKQTDVRNFSISLFKSSGDCEERSFSVPSMIYRGIFKAAEEYQPGDTVTWGGSLWHCNEKTRDKPGESSSKGWTLAAKRGRDAR